MTLQEIANEINILFRKYGLDHDVVRIAQGTYTERINFVRGNNPETMELLLTTLAYVFDVYFAAKPATEQMRLF